MSDRNLQSTVLGRIDSAHRAAREKDNFTSDEVWSEGGSRRPRVSLMIPCLNEEESLTHVLPEFIKKLGTDADFEFELLFIDDHSDDRTPQILTELCQRFENVQAIRLGRNCGSHTAYRAGLDYCTGDAVAFTVADLQEGLELIRQSLQLWKNGASVVGTVAIGRDRGGFLNEAGARLFYWLRHRLGRSPSRDAAEAALRVIDRSVVTHCQRYAPRTRNLNTWIFGQPFTVQFLKYTPTQRRYGSSRWTFRKKMQLVVDTLLDASPVFLTMWLVVGSFMFGTAILALMIGLVRFWWNGAANSSPILMLVGVLCACTGLVLLSAGTLGVYVWRIYEELRGGPGYVAQPLAEASMKAHCQSVADRQRTPANSK